MNHFLFSYRSTTIENMFPCALVNCNNFTYTMLLHIFTNSLIFAFWIHILFAAFGFVGQITATYLYNRHREILSPEISPSNGSG